MFAREEALDAVYEAAAPDDALLSTTGLMSRSLHERHDSPNQYYNTGSFGLVSSVGLGFALSKPDVNTIVVDGDASLLTNFNTLVTIGRYKPENLVHVVIDNNSYGSCSEEIDVVIASFDRSFDYHKLNVGFQALRCGARFLATNADRTCPVAGGEIPDAGAGTGD